MSQYNKIFFQAATAGVAGWAEFVAACNAKQIPVGAAVTDSTSLLMDLQTSRKKTGVANRGNFRPTGVLSEHEMHQLGISRWGGNFDLTQPDMLTQGHDKRYSSKEGAEKGYEIIGKYHVQAVLSKIPPELDKRMISICSWNEVVQYKGWQEATNTKPLDLQNTVVGYQGWADVIGRQAYWIGKELIRRKEHNEKWFRWAAFAFSGGNPDEGVWEAPGMLDYLRLAAEHPDVLGIALHEYALSLNIMDGFKDGFAEKTHIGRFEKLFATCDKHNIARPWVEITEWGWDQATIPEKEAALAQIKEVAAYYAKFPEVKLAAIWTLSGDKNWAHVNKQVEALAPDLYQFTLNTTFPDPKEKKAADSHPTAKTKKDKPQDTNTDLKGIDTSSATLTTQLLQTNRPAFAFQRAILWEGQHGIYRPYADPRFSDNIAACAAAGVPVGAYTVLYPDAVEASAKLFAQQIQAVQGQKDAKPLRGAIAVEIESLTAANIHTFLQTLATHLPHDHPKPIIMTRQAKWEAIMGSNTAWAADYPLWIIDWDNDQPKVPAPWQTWDIWQYGSAKWGDVAVDRNKMVSKGLKALALPTITNPKPAPKPKPVPKPTPEPHGPLVNMTQYFVPKTPPYGPKITLHNKEGQGQSLQIYQEGKDAYLLKGSEHEKRVIADGKIFLTEDTSQGNGRFYRIKAPETGWIPQKMAVGQRYTRRETVTHYELADCKPVSGGSSTITTYIRFAKIHTQWQSPMNSKINFENVVELVWEIPNAQGGGFHPQEIYFYAPGVGLVGWVLEGGKEVGWIVEVTHGQAPLTLHKINC